MQPAHPSSEAGNPVDLPDAAPASPCNSVCKMDRDSGLCLGCWRTLDEIAAWSSLDAAQQHQVLRTIDLRLASSTKHLTAPTAGPKTARHEP